MTHRFQTARTDVRFLLLQSLLPWLENMELLASSVPATISPLSYIMYYPDSGMKGRKDGSGSTEATEMILNNLFYITAKVSSSEVNVLHLKDSCAHPSKFSGNSLLLFILQFP
jgi:hypothetical protein